ncbi:hypothetical protein FLL45_11125 [Aliikangiella marina]|uniref:DUF2971 domain-containing protein n=1 Tax=Aliikangiella marina TaxID=1712262 RepID=A0A545TE19_9GAMM|nr:hypothetical protein [Aliikangiella marina]TQV75465.1 hypothetical protein FLL45_11125 [Aliikangiella marina]
MSILPATLTYFGSLQHINQVINKTAIPLKEAHQLADPFLPDHTSEMEFTIEDFFEEAVKYIAHSILGRSAPRGQPNHPLQKAIMRWRLEDRFKDESEIREALQGLLPAMVEKAFNEAREHHELWATFVERKRLIPFYEKYQKLELWLQEGQHHRGAAIKFKCDEDSIFEYCHPVSYSKIPAKTVDLRGYIDHMTGNAQEIEFDPQKTILAQNYAMREFKEWRLLVDISQVDDTFIEFPIDQIQSVYIGALVSADNVAQFTKHLEKVSPKIKVFQAVCRPNEYSFEFERTSS